MDAECPSCGRSGDVEPGVPFPSRLLCPWCGAAFFEDDAGVSPVVGVLLMIALTFAIAAGAFLMVSDLGGVPRC